MDYHNRDGLQANGIAVLPKKIVRGIPCFDELPYYNENIFHMSRQTMLNLILLAGTVGWKQAVLDGISLDLDWLRHYITSPKRTFFLSILEIGEGDRVLDVGAGWGNISAQIAKGFPSTKVYAFDKTLETLLFADQIRKQERLGNMLVMQGDITNPPFEKKFFDVIIMQGLLEWLGTSNQNAPPRVVQRRALTAIREILKPKGRLLIGIENRIGFQYFLGARDEHSGLRFTNLMPRYIADLYMKLRGRGPYRTYTYTRRGYGQLLREAGFSDITFYMPIPDYVLPDQIFDLEGAKELAKDVHIRGARMLPWSVFGTFANSFYIIARSEM